MFSQLINLIFNDLIIDNNKIKKQTILFFKEQLHLNKYENSKHNIDSFVEQIVNSSKENKVIIFVARNYASFPSIISANRYFKKNGYITLGIYLDNLPKENEFDYYYNCQGSLASLIFIFSRINNDFPIYLQAHGKWASLLVLLRTISSSSFIVHEIYDWVSDFIGVPEDFIKNELFTADEIDLVCFYESQIMFFSDAVLYKNASLLTSESPSKSFRIYPIVNIERSKDCGMMLLPEHNCYKFLFAGQIKSKSSPDEVYGDIDFLDLIQKITAQKISLTYYNAPIFSQLFEKDEYSTYISESNKNSFFSFKRSVPRDELIDISSGKYHAGLILYRCPKKFSVGSAHIEGAFDSKVFTYLEAGLPIIVSEEFKFMADFVRQNKVGIVVSENDISNFKVILKNINFISFQKNISIALQNCNNDHVFQELIARIESPDKL